MSNGVPTTCLIVVLNSTPLVYFLFLVHSDSLSSNPTIVQELIPVSIFVPDKLSHYSWSLALCSPNSLCASPLPVYTALHLDQNHNLISPLPLWPNGCDISNTLTPQVSSFSGGFTCFIAYTLTAGRGPEHCLLPCHSWWVSTDALSISIYTGGSQVSWGWYSGALCLEV